jgi:Acetyltransferase (GNAT) domain
MALAFQAVRDPASELLRNVAASAPENPFYTPAYAEARRILGEWPWMLTLQDEDHLVAACPAFLRSGWLSQTLEVPSIRTDPDGGVFWGGLLESCRRAGVTHLEVNSYASTHATIPPLRGEVRRTGRTEYVLELTQPDLWKLLREGHRRSVNRARKAGLTLRRSREVPAYHQHVLMMSASMARRQDRGETVPQIAPGSLPRRSLDLLQAGAGELVQVVHDGDVLSSVLVLRSQSGAYYYSAGTRPDGMNCGASQFLIFETACALQREGLLLFNLGGAGAANAGLRDFKLGFGAVPRELEAVEVDLATPSRKMLRTAARGLCVTLSKMRTRT